MTDMRLGEDHDEPELAVSLRMQRINQILVNSLPWFANLFLIAAIFAAAAFFLKKYVPTIAVDPFGRVYPLTIINSDRLTTQKK